MKKNRKITEEILDSYLIDLMRVYQVAQTQDPLAIHLELAHLSDEGLRIVQSAFFVGRQGNGKKPRVNGYKIINTYMDEDNKDNIILYLTGKRAEVFLRDFERGLMLSGMLDKVRGALLYEKLSSKMSN